MTKRLFAAVLFCCSTAWAAASPVDAFLSRGERKPLVTASELSSPARAALARGYVSSSEPRLGVPTFFWSSPEVAGRSFADMGLTPEQAARRYLLTHAELYRGVPSRWAEARVSGVHDLHDGGAVIVSFQQRVNGVRVFRDELRVIMTAKLGLVAMSGYLTPETRVRGDFALSGATAIGSAYQSLAGLALEPSALVERGVFNGGYTHWRLAGSDTDVRSRPVYFPLPDGLVPGFYVELELPNDTEGRPTYFSFVVSAVDGAVLYRKDLTADAFSYRVWADAAAPHVPLDGPQGSAATPHPTGLPDGFDPGTTTQIDVSLDNAGLSTNDPWLDPAATETRGNNVWAYADIARSNGFTQGMDIAGTVSAPGEFHYAYDFGLGPNGNVSQQRAAVTQLFFNNNFFHDWFYDDGFNEAAGNAQTNNLGRGGLGNDALRGEAQDYSGTDNANMSTPSDGASPRMQMYVFLGEDAAQVTLSNSTTQFFTYGAEFGPQTHDVTGVVQLAADGDATPTDGCIATWPGDYTGKIALIDRGTCTFAEKALRAQAAGAIGVVIANNQMGGAMQMPGMGAVTIPVMSVSLNGGNIIKNAITSSSGAATIRLLRNASSNRDGTLDNAVVAHEWGHYVSNRLIGDANGLSNQQGVGMGEGWGDFHGMLMTVRETDVSVPGNTNWEGVYSLAGWAGFTTDPQGYYYGFRRYPMSTALTKNPLTFRHISNGVALPMNPAPAFGASGNSNAEVHATGEVWAVMLWEVYAALLRDPRYTFAQAQGHMKRYLIGGYKATPDMPTFVDARDAVLAVAAARDATDFANAWAAFARRGLGMGAVAPDRDSQTNSPLTESFMVGNAVSLTSVSIDDSTSSCDNDGRLDANESGLVTITLRNTGVATIANATVTISTAVAGVTFPSGVSQALQPLQPFGMATLVFPVALGDVAGVQGGNFNVEVADSSLVGGPMTQTAMFRLNYDVVPMRSRTDDVEAPSTVWTASSDPQLFTGNDFRITQSDATQHYWFGPNPAAPADTWLTSPELNVGAQPLTISFKHRWDFEFDSNEFYDGAVLEVSSNGGFWTDVGGSSRPGYTGTISDGDGRSSNPLGGRRGFVGKSAGYPMFNSETIDLGTAYANQTIRFRFRIGADDAASAKGWEIDDIVITGITNRPFAAVTSDPNMCTNAAPTATIGPNIEVNERETVTLVGGGTDPDGDTVTATWTQLQGPAVTLSGATFTAPDVDVDTLLVFQMTATDGRAVTDPLEQQVLVKNVNRPPVVSLPSFIEVQMGTAVTVTGMASDADGDAITVEWTQLSGPQVALAGTSTAIVSFTAPDVPVNGVVQLQLVARDAVSTSAPAVIDVIVRNPNPVETVDPDIKPMPTGCGCSGGFELFPLAALIFALRARRKR